ncbi:MAG: hypothetical protein DME54_08645 [Verrucomicrobia bacterium]|nr:MAG: hypothetical protein DME62_15400 [Verrucomicrobiota bacterium]PYK34332.1 MAG: hypothetical protein DME54_08645 [Verrucomicrobiota bacterium]
MTGEAVKKVCKAGDSTAILLPQPRHYLFQNRKRPTTFIDLVGRQSVVPLNIDALMLTQFLEWN